MREMIERTRRVRRLAELQMATIALSLSIVAVASVATANAMQAEKLRAGFKPLARTAATPTIVTAAVDLSSSRDD
jgi:hypothetical protein